MESVIMCKVIGFTNFKNVREKLGTIEYLSQLLLETEKDGFGYAIWDNNSKKVFGERTTERTFSSATRKAKSDVELDFCEESSAVQNSFGEFDLSNTGAAIFHGRISTNNKNLLNTHPMAKDGWALIHNGVVTDHGDKYETVTTNDSEHVLTRYVDGTFEKALTGYYAFLAIDKQGDMHVVKDKIANLYSSWIESLDTYIFSTNEANIQKICKALKVDYSTILKYKDDQLAVFTGNKVIAKRKIESRGYSYQESKWSQRSLGYNLDARWNGGTVGGAKTTAANKPDPKMHTTTPTTTTETSTIITVGNESVVHLNKGKKGKKHRGSGGKELPYRSLTPDEVSYIQEVSQMDESYTVVNPKGRRVRIVTFKELEFAQQKFFDVIRPDGTVVDWVDYSTDKLSDWNI
jgi:predicted glutamine amidotransferase